MNFSLKNFLSINKKTSGFTLIEILIALVISGIVVSVLSGLFSSAKNTSSLEADKLELRQEIRAILDIIETDIKSAGLNPLDNEPKNTPNTDTDNVFDLAIEFDISTGDEPPGIRKATANEIEFTADLNGDGSIDINSNSDYEYIKYIYDDGKKELFYDLTYDATSNPVKFADNLQSFSFAYFDNQGNSIPPPGTDKAVISTIASVNVSVSKEKTSVKKKTIATAMSRRIDIRN